MGRAVLVRIQGQTRKQLNKCARKLENIISFAELISFCTQNGGVQDIQPGEKVADFQENSQTAIRGTIGFYIRDDLDKY